MRAQSNVEKSMRPSPRLAAALEAARAAAGVISEAYRGNVRVRTKADRTPVTDVDVAAEEAIRQVLSRRFPEDGFYGEETGVRAGRNEWTWLVDPIDGTRSFVRGYPFFSTQIAAMRAGEIVLGVSSAPLFDELAWAERGAGAWLNEERCRVSDIATLDDAAVSSGNLKSLARGSRWAAWGSVVAEVARIRGYGDFYHYHLLAAGRIDGVVESDVNILDIAALSVIVAEAGGVFTDLDGQPVGLETTSVLAGNPAIYKILGSRL
jgi:histidinol-phosphatase